MTVGVDWESANCKSVGADFFYSEDKVFADPQNVRKKVCGNCLIRDDCLEFAMDTGERWGIWGGKTSRERLKMIRERLGDPAWRWPYHSLADFLYSTCPNDHVIAGSNVFIDHNGSRRCASCYGEAYQRRRATA